MRADAERFNERGTTMFHDAYSIGGTLLVALLTAVVTPAPVQAQHGGGHGGGFHGGGGHFGGFRGGGFHHGFSHFGVSPRFGYRSFGYRPYYRPYYGGYSYTYPSYGYYPYSYGYYPDYSGYYPSYSYDDSSGAVMPSTPDDSGTSLSPTSQQTAPAQPDTRAFITVKVPADAVVSFNGETTSPTGTVRQYSSPPLEPGRTYSYEVRASWQEDGRAVTQTQRVPLAAGAHPTVVFPVTRTGSATTAH